MRRRVRVCVIGVALAGVLAAATAGCSSHQDSTRSSHAPAPMTSARSEVGTDVGNAGRMCHSSAVVGFRVDLRRRQGTASAARAVAVWRQVDDRSRIWNTENPRVKWAAVGTNLHRPRVVLVVERHGPSRWFVERTFGCATSAPGSTGRCIPTIAYRGHGYTPGRTRSGRRRTDSRPGPSRRMLPPKRPQAGSSGPGYPRHRLTKSRRFPTRKRSCFPC